MSEDALWKEIRPMLKGRGIHASRVESHSTSPGFPDVDLCIEGVEFTIELKFGTDKKLPEVRDSQILWHRRRVKAGGRAAILAKLMLGNSPHYMFYHGRYLNDLFQCKTSAEWIKVPGVFVPSLNKQTLIDCLMQTLHTYDEFSL